MSKAVIAQLEGSSLTADELERLRAFIRSEKDSTLGMLLQRLIEVHGDGITLHFISDDAELSPNQAAKLLKMSRPHLLKFMKHARRAPRSWPKQSTAPASRCPSTHRPR